MGQNEQDQVEVVERGKEIDELLNKMPAYIKTKVDEAKGRIDIVKKSIEPKIFRILKQTRRGRFFCKLMGYKDENQLRKLKQKYLMKQRRKESKNGLSNY